MQTFRILTALGVVLALSACGGSGTDRDLLNMSTPSDVHGGKIKVTEKTVTEKLSAARVDSRRVADVARNILRNGQRHAALVMPYLPGQLGVTEGTGDAYKKAFAQQGVENLVVDYVPMREAELTQEAVIAYATLNAAPDSSCKRMPGLRGAETAEGFKGYQFGCEMQTVLSQMVANPADLLGAGRSALKDGISRRAGPTVENYVTGVANDRLDGISASSVGQ